MKNFDHMNIPSKVYHNTWNAVLYKNICRKSSDLINL